MLTASLKRGKGPSPNKCLGYYTDTEAQILEFCGM